MDGHCAVFGSPRWMSENAVAVKKIASQGLPVSRNKADCNPTRKTNSSTIGAPIIANPASTIAHGFDL